MLTISPDKLPQWLDQANERHRAAVLRGLRKAAHLSRGQAAIRTSRAQPFPAVDTGRLKNSWVTIETADGAVLFNDAPYAGAIELGVRPGRIPLPDKGRGKMAPFASIVRWAERKFTGGMRAPRAASKTASPRARLASVQRRLAFDKTKADFAFAIAIAVQRKLHYRGIEGRRILTAPAFVRQMRDITAREIGRELRGARDG